MKSKIKETVASLSFVIGIGLIVYAIFWLDFLAELLSIVGIDGIVICFVSATLIFLCDDYRRRKFERAHCDVSFLKKEGLL